MSLQDNQVRISDSAIGKARVVEWIGINTRWDLKVITILTKRKFFGLDESNNLTEQLVGVDYNEYEHNLVASNDKLCNPANGLMVSASVTTDASGNTSTVYHDAIGNVVDSPIGLFDFFRPLLSQPVSQNDLIRQNILAEDQVYSTWNK